MFGLYFGAIGLIIVAVVGLIGGLQFSKKEKQPVNNI
jgi:hypothetical protein